MCCKAFILLEAKMRQFLYFIVGLVGAFSSVMGSEARSAPFVGSRHVVFFVYKVRRINFRN